MLLKKTTILLLFLTITINSFSQSISLLGSYPLIPKADYKGVVDVQLQMNIICAKNYNWCFGINLDYINLKKQNTITSNMYQATFNLEYQLEPCSPVYNVIVNTTAGYYYETKQDGIALGTGVMIDRAIFTHTQLFLFLKGNILVNNFCYFNMGIGIRRSF